MRFAHFVKTFAPVAAVAMAAVMSSGCHGTINIDGEEGSKLADLDMSGTAPDELELAGPDEVRVTQGAKLAITVDGDPATAATMRFTLKHGKLGIKRENSFNWHDNDKTVVVNVTMPAPKEVTLAGSGKVIAATLAKDAEITIAGSGDVESDAIAADSLKLTVAGSGNFRGAGNARKFDLNIAGSGSIAAGALRVDTAKVTIAGSGDATFASDGDVDATIMGSGEVRVKGRARCKVTSMGSGKLICEAGESGAPAPTASAG